MLNPWIDFPIVPAAREDVKGKLRINVPEISIFQE